ncbi:MAG: hypothetical protein HUJ60_01875, partial [Bacilli bacterium]|nr:hypothetical protein [Bacilli bacterium]
DLARRKKKLISPAPEPISAPVASLLPEGIVATPRYAYAPSLKGTGYRIRLNDPYSKDTLPLFEAAIAAMPETIMPRVSPSVVFTPEIPTEEALATLIRPLKTEAWDVLVGLFASSGKAAELVLSNKENPSLCLTLLLEGEPTLLAYAGNGFSLSAMRLSFADVLAITKGN